MGLSGIRNIDHTVLLCARLSETRAFYRDVMGFPIEVDHATWVSFRVGSSHLSLRERGRFLDRDDGALAPGTAPAQLAFRVPPADFDAAHRELVAAGAESLRGPTDLPQWRHRTLFFRDPEGTILEIYAEI